MSPNLIIHLLIFPFLLPIVVRYPILKQKMLTIDLLATWFAIIPNLIKLEYLLVNLPPVLPRNLVVQINSLFAALAVGVLEWS